MQLVEKQTNRRTNKKKYKTQEQEENNQTKKNVSCMRSKKSLNKSNGWQSVHY